MCKRQVCEVKLGIRPLASWMDMAAWGVHAPRAGGKGQVHKVTLDIKSAASWPDVAAWGLHHGQGVRGRCVRSRWASSPQPAGYTWLLGVAPWARGKGQVREAGAWATGKVDSAVVQADACVPQANLQRQR